MTYAVGRHPRMITPTNVAGKRKDLAVATAQVIPQLIDEVKREHCT